MSKKTLIAANNDLIIKEIPMYREGRFLYLTYKEGPLTGMICFFS